MTFSNTVNALTLVVLACAPSLIQADTTPPCQTNTGIDGVVFAGFYGTIRAPSGFETVTISDFNGIETVGRMVGNDTVTVFADIALGDDIVIYAAPDQPETAQTIIGFGDGAPTSCFVTVLPFDPAVRDLSATALGHCDFNLTDGVTQIKVGTAAVFDLPDRVFETASAPVAISQAIPRSATQIEISGDAKGAGTVLWSGEDTGNGTLKGLCPIIVVD